MVRLRFSGGLGLPGRVVKLATWSWCSHVDIVLPDGRLLGAVPRYGVSIRDLLDSKPDTRYEDYLVNAPADRVIQCAMQHLGKPYDWRGIVGFGTRRDWHHPDRWFCSELVAEAFSEAGVPLLRGDKTWRLSPRDLLLSPLLLDPSSMKQVNPDQCDLFSPENERTCHD